MMTATIKRNLPRHTVGALSIALSGYFVSNGLTDPVIFLASAFFLIICTTDTLKTKIPNLACLILTLSVGKEEVTL